MAKPASLLPAPLADGARRFDAWRRKRRTQRIPEDLWALATDLGVRHGVSRTARALRVQYYDLKKRVEAVGTGVREDDREPPAFVEFVAAPPGSESAWRVEFESPSGAKMRVEVKGPVGPDLVELSRLFLGGRP